jgi:transposase-like protein
MAAAGGREKPPEEWEARAEEMGKMQGESPNVREFVACMDLTGCATLLHIGWGRGAIALALSSHETLSALTDQVLETAECFRRRPLPPEMAFVYLHGLALKLCQEEEGVLRVSVYVAWG